MDFIPKTIHSLLTRQPINVLCSHWNMEIMICFNQNFGGLKIWRSVQIQIPEIIVQFQDELEIALFLNII